jgi:hypothetical protein
MASQRLTWRKTAHRRALPMRAAAVSLALAGCGAAWSPEAPLGDVRCTDGLCLGTVADAVSDELFLGDQADCPHRLLVRGAVLVGDGEQVALFGPLLKPNHTRLGKDQYLFGLADVAALQQRPSDGCLPVAPVPAESADSSALALRGAAATVAPDGSFLAFVGVARTERVLHLRDGRLTSRSMPGPTAAPDGDEVWASRALRLPDGQTLVVRPRTTTAMFDRHLGLEWIDPEDRGSEGQGAAIWPEDGAIAGDVEANLEGMPGRVRAFWGGDDRVVLLGERGIPVPFSHRGGGAVPERAGPARPGSLGAALVLLPSWLADRGYAAGSALSIGGEVLGDGEGARFDVYQPDRNDWRWKVATTPWPLHYPAAVLLPTGEIALVGGRADDRHVLYVDTQRDFALTEGRAELARPCGAGTSTLLLPSGAVVVTAGYYTAAYRPADYDQERPGVQILRPPYLASAVARRRPVITQPPPRELRPGQAFTLGVTASPEAALQVVLMAFGATLVGQNVDQRLVELEITGRADGILTVQSPPSTRLAPPGRYLLFVVRQDGDQRLPSPGVAVSLVAP